jgi:MATE family multidrug resistance protein
MCLGEALHTHPTNNSAKSNKLTKMSFVVHTEELNLVCAVAAEQADDESSAEDESLSFHRTPEVGTLASQCHELKSVFHIALPTVVIQLGGVLPSFLTASYIGRNFSAVYLSGFTLASLTGNLFTLSLLQGLYSASDTLSPQAYGAGNTQEVGILAIRGYVGSMIITLPSIILLGFIMDRLLVHIGEDPEAAVLAWRWYQIYAVSLPFYALYQVTWKFLSAQNTMLPLVVCTLLSCGVVLPVALHVAGAASGFLGTAVAIVVFQVFQSLSLLAYLWYFKPHNTSTWLGLKRGWTHAVKWEPFCAYMVRSS